MCSIWTSFGGGGGSECVCRCVIAIDLVKLIGERGRGGDGAGESMHLTLHH